MMRLLFESLALILLTWVLAAPALAFPQYADWITEKSGVTVNCAYCHTNREGPQGSGPGQEDSLSAKQLELLHSPESPILNKFGQSIIWRLGYEKTLELISEPEKLASQMRKYDLDQDGVSDGIEMEYATLADDPLSAPPSQVWLPRLQANFWFVIAVVLGATTAAVGLTRCAASLTHQGGEG